jgi:sodium/hydrogen exchanger-like protein 6/7
MMSIKLPSVSLVAPPTTSSPASIPEEEEYYSSWSLFLVCMLLILSLWTSYYLQIKRIRAIHETLVSIFAGMTVGLIVRLAPGTMIREMLVRFHFVMTLLALWGHFRCAVACGNFPQFGRSLQGKSI